MSGFSRRKLAAIKKISYQFPKTPEGKLMFAVVRQAIEDLNCRKPGCDSTTARMYIEGPMWHAQSCGVDPDWIRSVLKKLQINT